VSACFDAVLDLTPHGLDVQPAGAIKECVQDRVDPVKRILAHRFVPQRYDVKHQMFVAMTLGAWQDPVKPTRMGWIRRSG
jgi:hypothetical protein